MIEIINNQGNVLELSAGTVIPVERNNSLFGEKDDFFQDLTYPGKAGLTENNKVFIMNGHLVESENDVYRLDVKVMISGYIFFAGIFSYTVVSGEINFTLKFNFGTIAETVKTTSIRDIYTLDADPSISTNEACETMMLDTCVNPLNYNCVFLPVKNEKWFTGETELAYPWLNFWNHEDQKFDVFQAIEPDSEETTVQVPFFRVTYILRKVLECLQFNVSGGYFSDPNEQNHYFFTRRGTTRTKFLSSLSYMPDMKITDFLKQLVERKRIALDFDLLNKQITVETPETVLNSPEVIDITQYIESVSEIGVAESKGYEITLKIDDTDDAWNTGTAEERIFNPSQKLHIGQGETKVEMSIGTLNNYDDILYSYLINKQEINITGSESIIAWPLSILEYTGMKSVGGGDIYPEAIPVPLKLSDANWYKFLNDSKPVVIIANIPPDVLSRMKPTTKLGCISNEGSYFVALPVQISYTMTNRGTELIRTKIKARPLITRYQTQAFLEVIAEEVAGKRNVAKYVAYYDPEIHGITEVSVKRINISSGANIFGFFPITKPTNMIGQGGTIGMTYTISGDRTDRFHEERLYCGAVPKYYIKGGLKGYFTYDSGYYTFDEIDGLPPKDNKPTWIVF